MHSDAIKWDPETEEVRPALASTQVQLAALHSHLKDLSAALEFVGAPGEFALYTDAIESVDILAAGRNPWAELSEEIESHGQADHQYAALDLKEEDAEADEHVEGDVEYES